MVRKAEITDLLPLAELFEGYRSFYNKPKDQLGVEEFLSERINNGDSEIFVLESEGLLCGFVQLYPLFSSTRMKKYWLLNDLFVDEKSRGKGFSKLLIESAQELCKYSGACGILLETGKNNDIGNRLYPACGFELYDEVNFYEWTNKE